MKAVLVMVIAVVFAAPFAIAGRIPDSRYQYAADGEYDDILCVLPWVAEKVKDPAMTFKRPKCAEQQGVVSRYSDSTLFNGVIKLVGGNVVGLLSIIQFNNTPEFEVEMRKVLSASKEEMATPSFVKSIASLAGRKDIVEIGMTVVSGLNAFYSTTKMERRVGNQVIYRGVQRVYFIPLRDGKKVIAVNFGVGVLGVDEIPYADFKAFCPIGEKFVGSLSITNDCRWKFWQMKGKR